VDEVINYPEKTEEIVDDRIYLIPVTNEPNVIRVEGEEKKPTQPTVFGTDSNKKPAVVPAPDSVKPNGNPTNLRPKPVPSIPALVNAP
jgi:hypothetical protein